MGPTKGAKFLPHEPIPVEDGEDVTDARLAVAAQLREATNANPHLGRCRASAVRADHVGLATPS